jgi:hypothetical protein
MSTFKTMPIQYGYTKMRCGNTSKQMKMKTHFKFKTVSATKTGDYYQIVFHNDLDTDDEPYFMIQSQFEIPDGGECNFESHIEELIGQCKAKSVSLSKNKISLSYGEDPPHEVDIEYDLHGLSFQELASMLEEMIPEIEIAV